MDLQQLIPVILDLLCKNENEGYDIREEQEQLRTQFALQVDSLQYRIRIDNAYTVATACYPCSFYATYTTTNNTGYWDIVHPGLDDTRLDSSYHANYRVNRDTFNLLVATLSQHPVYQSRNPAYPQTPCYIQVATILWRMTNTHAGYRIVKNTMGISNGSYMNFTTRFLKAMVDCFKHKIHWPTTESEVRRTIASFTARPDSEGVIRGRLPCGVIGALDGKLVNIFKPYNVHSEYYRDRKGNLSMNLTAICDGDLRFTYVYTGNPGRTHDSRAFRRSHLYDLIQESGSRMCPNNSFIIAGSAYPLQRHVITPYPRRQAIPSQRKFNKVHSSTRMAIERAFGLLVARWRFIGLHLYLTNEIRQGMTIFVSCILHNICIDQNDIIPEAILQQEAAENLQPHPPTPTSTSTMNGMDETDTNMDIHADASVSDLRDGIERREQIRVLLDGMVLD